MAGEEVTLPLDLVYVEYIVDNHADVQTIDGRRTK